MQLTPLLADWEAKQRHIIDLETHSPKATFAIRSVLVYLTVFNFNYHPPIWQPQVLHSASNNFKQHFKRSETPVDLH